jgi:hypothetical protein
MSKNGVAVGLAVIVVVETLLVIEGLALEVEGGFVSMEVIVT